MALGHFIPLSLYQRAPRTTRVCATGARTWFSESWCVYILYLASVLLSMARPSKRLISQIFIGYLKLFTSSYVSWRKRNRSRGVRLKYSKFHDGKKGWSISLATSRALPSLTTKSSVAPFPISQLTVIPFRRRLGVSTRRAHVTANRARNAFPTTFFPIHSRVGGE